HQPDAAGAEVGVGARVAVVDVVEARDDAAEIADAVAIAVLERSHEDLVARCAARPRGCLCRKGRENGAGDDRTTTPEQIRRKTSHDDLVTKVSQKCRTPPKLHKSFLPRGYR